MFGSRSAAPKDILPVSWGPGRPKSGPGGRCYSSWGSSPRWALTGIPVTRARVLVPLSLGHWYQLFGFLSGSGDKESICNAGDLGSIPGLGRSPGEGKGYPLQCSGLENSMDSTVHGVEKSRTRLSDFHQRFGPCSSPLVGGLSMAMVRIVITGVLPWWSSG